MLQDTLTLWRANPATGNVVSYKTMLRRPSVSGWVVIYFVRLTWRMWNIILTAVSEGSEFNGADTAVKSCCTNRHIWCIFLTIKPVLLCYHC